MTENGTFIINGTERVVVSPAPPSPGRVLRPRQGQDPLVGQAALQARVIPYRGSWLDFEFDHKDIIYVRIDRRRKLHATVLLRALGYSDRGAAQLLLRHRDASILEQGKKYAKSINYDLLAGPAGDARHQVTRVARGPGQEEPQVHQVRPSASSRKPGIDRLPVEPEELVGKVCAQRRHRRGDRRGPPRQCNEEVTEEKLEELRERGVDEFKVLFIDGLNVGRYLRDTLIADKLADARRGDHGDLPAPAPGRSAHPRDGAEPLPQPVLQPRALRPLARSAA